MVAAIQRTTDTLVYKTHGAIADNTVTDISETRSKEPEVSLLIKQQTLLEMRKLLHESWKEASGEPSFYRNFDEWLNHQDNQIQTYIVSIRNLCKQVRTQGQSFIASMPAYESVVAWVQDFCQRVAQGFKPLAEALYDYITYRQNIDKEELDKLIRTKFIVGNATSADNIVVPTTAFNKCVTESHKDSASLENKIAPEIAKVQKMLILFAKRYIYPLEIYSSLHELKRLMKDLNESEIDADLASA